jgi:hypothetical protein
VKSRARAAIARAFCSPQPDLVVVGGLTGVSVTTVRSGRPRAGQRGFEHGSNLPGAPVWDTDWDAADRVLTVATLGRGAWQATLPALREEDADAIDPAP